MTNLEEIVRLAVRETARECCKLMCRNCQNGERITAQFEHQINDGLQARGLSYRHVPCAAEKIRRNYGIKE